MEPLEIEMPHAEQFDPVVLRTTLFSIRLSQLRYTTFTIIGIALLWPWNAFLSASGYYSDRFQNTKSLVRIYLSTMMSVSTITQTIYSFYLTKKQEGVSYPFRIRAGLGITAMLFMLMAFSCVGQFFIDLNDYVFFFGFMVVVAVSAMATCLAQTGTMATVNVLGQVFTNAVMVGQAIAGTLPAVALIVSVSIAGELTKDKVESNYGLFMYYITASLVSVVGIMLLWLADRDNTEAAYRSLSADEELISVREEKQVPFWVLWKKLRLIVTTIFLTFCVTLMFPVFASVVRSVNPKPTGPFSKSIFVPFVYLMWNLGDLVGRILCGLERSMFLISDSRSLIRYSIFRIAFIPLFMTCNIRPGKSDPVILSDLWYVLLQFLFGLSNGQLCTLCFMVVGSYCDTDDEKEAAGGFTAVFLGCGLAAGSVLSYLLVLAIN